MRVPIEVSRKDFEKLKKLYEGTSNNVMFFNDRFIKNGGPKHKNLTKKTKNSIRS